MDTGHFHLTESIADKVSALLLFTPEIMLHVSRPIRWDSDHVVILSDDLLDLAREIIRCKALDRVHIGLDYFDATINRIGGVRDRLPCNAEGLYASPSRTVGNFAAVRSRRQIFPAFSSAGGNEEPSVDSRLGYVLPAKRRSGR